MVDLDSIVANPRPAELRLFQPLGIKADPGAVAPDEFGPEDVKRVVERIIAGIPHQRQQAVRALAEVDRMTGQENLYAGGDHADRTARITRCKSSTRTSV